MGRIEAQDPLDARIEPLTRMNRLRVHDRRRSQWVERWGDQRDARLAGVAAHWDELVVRSIREQRGRTGEGAAECRLPVAAVAELAHEVTARPQRMPTTEGDERTRR